MKSPSNYPILVVPREFGLILSCGGEHYKYEMTAQQQLSFATRMIEVASMRLREERKDAQKITAPEEPDTD